MWCVTDRQEQDPALFCLCNVMNTMVYIKDYGLYKSKQSTSNLSSIHTNDHSHNMS